MVIEVETVRLMQPLVTAVAAVEIITAVVVAAAECTMTPQNLSDQEAIRLLLVAAELAVLVRLELLVALVETQVLMALLRSVS